MYDCRGDQSVAGFIGFLRTISHDPSLARVQNHTTPGSQEEHPDP